MHKHTSSERQLSLAFFLNLCFAVIELIGGILTNSTAIIADAFHDFMDAVAIGIAVYIDKFSKKPASINFTYGYRRFSLLSAVILSVILLVGAVFMIYNDMAFLNQPKHVNSMGMLALAVLGIAVNGFAFLKIKNSNEHHHHEHAHVTHDANSKAIMLHLLEDVLGWIAVLIGAIVMYFTNWFWIDSLLTIAIALFIAYNAFRNLFDTFKILLQAVPESISFNKIKESIAQINDVMNVEELNIWSLDGIETIATTTVTITNISNYNNVQAAIKQIFKNNNIQKNTIEIVVKNV